MLRPVVLASASPRRQQLLRELVEEFEIVVSEVDEDALTVPDPWQTAEGLAEAKARAVLTLRPESLVIGGDTVVALPLEGGGYEQLTKPADPEDAFRILSALSGRTHQVVTGICLASVDRVETFSETASVTFRPLEESEIRAYIATGEPMDKAGAYGLQNDPRGFIVGVKGLRSAVIGFPHESIRPRLEARGIS